MPLEFNKFHAGSGLKPDVPENWIKVPGGNKLELRVPHRVYSCPSACGGHPFLVRAVRFEAGRRLLEAGKRA